MSVDDNAWVELRVGDLGEVFTGRTPPSATPGLFGEAYPFITPGDMRQGKYARKTDRSLSNEGAAFLRRIRLPANSICVSCIGWQMGEVIITDRSSFTNQQINTIVPKPDYDSSYLYYIFRLRKQELLSLGSGVGARTPILNKSAFCNLKVRVPSLSMQRRVASILGAYDDLIETNQRRIALLEGIAQRLYQEWFINYRFPGYESHVMVDAPEGMIPEGWIRRAFTDVADVLSGGTPRKDKPQFWNGDLPFFTPSDAPATAWALSTAAAITDDGLNACNSPLYDQGTVFITARGTVGKIAMAGLPMAMNQSCYALQGKGYPQFFIFELTRAVLERLRAMSNGSVFDTIIVDTFRRLQVLAPPVDLAQRFDETIAPILLLARNIAMTNLRLVQSRDHIHPRLVSGELSIANAEREMDTAA